MQFDSFVSFTGRLVADVKDRALPLGAELAAKVQLIRVELLL
jgi:hypothetical protein